MKKKVTLWKGNCHIATLSKNSDKQAFEFFAHVDGKVPEKLHYTLVYPLTRPVNCTYDLPLNVFLDETGEVTETVIDVIDVLAEIAKTYGQLWKEHNNWFDGHCLGDLYFETLEINGDEIVIGLGS